MKKRYNFHSTTWWMLFLLCALHSNVWAEEHSPVPASFSTSYNTTNYFIENKGQWDASVRYLTRRNGMDMWVLDNAFVYDVYKMRHVAGERDSLDPLPSTGLQREGHIFRMNFLHANTATATGDGKRPEYHNYFIGNDPAHWASNVPLYNTVQLHDVYPGITAVVYDDGGAPRYDLVLQPNANPSAIAMNIEGANDWALDTDGNLVIHTSVGTVTHGKLFAYQEIAGSKHPVECKFTIQGEGKEKTLRFALGSYNRTLALVIDPLIYSTYIGGTANGNVDVAHGVQVDAAGNAYVTGYTNAAAFPAPQDTGPYTFGTRANNDVFVAKVYNDGSRLYYVTFIGGSGDDIARDIALDASNVYITGYTNSSNFYTTPGVVQPNIGSVGIYDAFVTKLSLDGNIIDYSTYLGGSDIDKAFAIDVEAGTAYITGYSLSTNYPTVNAYDAVGDINYSDVIVSKLNTNGSLLLYSTYLGGTVAGNQTTPDAGYDIVVRGGTAYITGMTLGLFPITPNAYNSLYNLLQGGNLTVNSDAFIAVLTNNILEYSTYFGGGGFENGTGIAVDGNDNIYIIGTTSSDETVELFPTTPNAFATTFGGNNALAASTDAFVAKFDPTLTSLLYSTYLGGNDVDFGYRLTLGGNDIVYAVGVTLSTNFPVAPNPGAYFLNRQGGIDLFFAKLQTFSGELLYSSLFGGDNHEGELVARMGINLQIDLEAALPSVGLAHLVLPNNTITVAGLTLTPHNSAQPFPISPNAYDATFNGNVDGFVTQFELDVDRIIVTSPVTETAACEGESLDIIWDRTTGIKKVRIELSDPTGTTFTQVTTITLPTPPPTEYTWTWNIPTGQSPGTYKVRVVDFSNSTIVSTTAVITVRSLPSIQAQPQDWNDCPGKNLSFSVTATGSDLQYQWYKVKTPPEADQLLSETSAILNVGMATLADNGTQYYVVVSNPCREVTSNIVTATVKEPPTVTGPSVTTVALCEGESTTLSISVTGTNTTIQWKSQRDPDSPPQIEMLNSTTYTISNVNRSADGTKYWAVVSGDCGEVTTHTVTLNVHRKPEIEPQPTPDRNPICEGETFALRGLKFSSNPPATGITWTIKDNGGNPVPIVNEASLPEELVIKNISLAWDGYTIVATIEHECGNVETDIITLHVLEKPRISTITPPPPIAPPVCEGDPFSITVEATGEALQYKWFKLLDDGSGNGTAILGATTKTLTFSPVVPSDQGQYYVVVSGECSPVATSATVELVVQTKPKAGTPSTSFELVCEGNMFEVTAAAMGTGATVQWQKFDPSLLPSPGQFADILGAQSTTFSISNVQESDAGRYRMVVSGACPPADYSAEVVLEVGKGPAVDSHPTNATVCAGGDAFFEVTVKAGVKPNPDISWQVSTDNGTNWSTMAGMTTTDVTEATLSLSNVSADMDGNLYRAVLTNDCGTISSAPAQLTVNTKPVAGMRPIDKTVCEGDMAQFTTATTGIPTPEIQWEVSANGGPFTDIINGGIYSGATAPTLTVSNIAFSHNGYRFRARFENACGRVYSTEAVLHVNTAPLVQTNPQNETVCENGSIEFTAAATGVPAPITIQWEIDNGGGFAPVNEAISPPLYTGSRTPTLSIANITAAMNGYQYRATFTNECGSTTTTIAVLSVKTLPKVSQEPTSATKCVGESHTFTVEAVGSDLSYQWYNGNGPISGATQATYTIPFITESHAGTYTVVVSGSEYCQPTTTASATLYVNTQPEITENPSSATKCEGEDVTFSVTATGTRIEYKWYKDGVAITSATSSTLTITGVTTADAGTYYVEVHGICPITPATSNIAQLTVNTAPSITNQPSSRSECEGRSVTFAVGAAGTGLTYQWRKNGGDIAGATDDQLTLTNITQADAGDYDVVISGTCPFAITSSKATLVVNAAPKITQQPQSIVLCDGETLQLNVEATGAGRTFQWRKNGAPIPAPAGTSQNYVVANATEAINGIYDVIVSGTCDPADTSQQADVRVQVAPVLVGAFGIPNVECPNGTSRDTVVLENNGEAPIAMNPLAISNLRFTVIEPVGAFIIPAKSTQNIIVEFRPQKAGVEIGSLSATTVRCNNQVFASLSAKADSVRIASLPEIRFTPVAQCDGPNVQEVFIENTGDVELRITPLFSDAQFALDNPADNPITLPAGTSKRVRIRFTSNGTPNTNIVANVRFRADKCNAETTTILRAQSIRVAYEATVPNGTLDFGILAGCKTNTTLQFPVRNTGNASITITSATTTNPAFGVSLPQTPLVLPVGSTAIVTVQFGSGPAGTEMGKLILRSGVPCPQDTTFDLIGKRGDVAISSNVQTVTFPKLLSCNVKTRDTVIEITNNGTEDASFAIPLVDAPFSIEGSIPPFPRIVQANETIKVRIAYKPIADGNHSSTARFPFTWGQCKDTLQIQVAGSFVTPTLTADVSTVDLGALLGCEGAVDTIITLTNPGNEDMRIDDIIDPAGYKIKELLSSSLPLVIPANGGSVELRIRFAPPSPGTYNRTLELTAQPCAVKVSIDLQGSKQGVSFTDIPRDTVDFGTIVDCRKDNIPAQSFTIVNTSDGSVQGTVSYSISGPFETTLQQGETLPNGTPVPFDITFKPTANGPVQGELLLRYEPCGITRTIVLKGSVAVVQIANSGDVDFGEVTVGTTSATQIVTFTNSGKAEVKITTVTSPPPPFAITRIEPALPATLKPGEALKVEVTMTPTAEGSTSATLRAESNEPCPVFSEVEVLGRGTNAPQPNIVFKGIDFGQVYVTKSRTMSITIRNNGFDKGNVFNITSADPQFVIEPLTYPLAIPKDDSVVVQVTFSPTIAGPQEALITITSDGGNPQDKAKGIGLPLPIGQTTLSLPILNADAGTKAFAVPITLDKQQKLDETRSITSLTFDVSFNATLFYPTHVTRGRIINNVFDQATLTRTITVEMENSDFDGIPSDGAVITEIMGDVLLGNSESTKLSFGNINWEVELGKAVATPIHGTLHLTNICRVGGDRLVRLNKAFGITAITPNPANDMVEIVVEVPGNGEASLSIHSLDGKQVYQKEWTVARIHNPDGTLTTAPSTVFAIPTTELSSGTYQVILRARERLDTQRLLIVK